jgi:trehalose synthase-fused probable maltokinase
MSLPAHSTPPGLPPVGGGWEALVDGEGKQGFETALAAHMAGQRWFRGKARAVAGVRIGDAIPIRREGAEACVLIVEVAYAAGPPEAYVVPLAGAVPHDAMDDAWFREALLEELARGSSVSSARGEIAFLPASEQLLRAVLSAGGLDTVLLGAEQSNTSIAYGKRFVLKLYRVADAGVSPEVEIGSFLTARKFAHAPALRGRVEYRPRGGVAMVIAVLADHIAHEADGWKHALGALAESLGRARSLGPADLAPPGGSLLELAGAAPPRAARDLLGEYAGAARLLGKRTAELHLALSSDAKDPAFAPEPFGAGARAALHGSMTGLVREVFGLLRRGLDGLPGGVREKARRVLDLEGAALERFGALLELPLASLRIRRHGDYHLGQVLWTGRDFVITDFEGEVARPLTERRAKSSALRDIAGMVRSFHYAAGAALMEGKTSGAEERTLLELAAGAWATWAAALFMGSYLDLAGRAPFVPPSRAELEGLLDAHLLEKAVYEIGYELNNRPDWLTIPLDGVLGIVG